jgi:hypothetical protein
MSVNISKSEAIRELWKRGNLDFKFHKNQIKLKEQLHKTKGRIKTILCSRQFGKTHLLVGMALEKCIQKKGAIVFYVCPGLKQGQENIENVMRNLLNDCPEDMLPEWKEQKKSYIFPNGSVLRIAGTDNKNHESLRGRTADMCIVDEAGFADDLKYVVKSVLFPTVLHTKGKIFLVSTPSSLFDHDFIQHFVLPAKAKNDLPIYTIHDNPRVDQDTLDEVRAEYIDWENDPEYQREYLCKIVQDRNSVVIPEFDEETELKIVRKHDRPAYYDIYVSGDIGFKDLTVFLFAYYDFMNATIVIEDELVMNGPSMTTERLAREIREKEEKLFVDCSNIPIPPYLRIMDNHPIMINDFQRLHNLTVIPTAKDDKEAQINHVRLMIKSKKIKIHPRCKHLIHHLKNATWDKNRKEFRRMNDIIGREGGESTSIRGGHADALDALIYLVRNVVKSKNPFPEDWDRLKGPMVQNSRFEKNNNSEIANLFQKIFRK